MIEDGSPNWCCYCSFFLRCLHPQNPKCTANSLLLTCNVIMGLLAGCPGKLSAILGITNCDP